MNIESLAAKECANYFNKKCMARDKKCWVMQNRCGYFETAVIPGVNRTDHPDYKTYKTAIEKYRNTIQYIENK